MIATKRLAELPEKESITGGEKIYINDDGDSKQIDATKIKPDLSSYATKDYVDNKTNGFVPKASKYQNDTRLVSANGEFKEVAAYDYDEGDSFGYNYYLDESNADEMTYYSYEDFIYSVQTDKPLSKKKKKVKEKNEDLEQRFYKIADFDMEDFESKFFTPWTSADSVYIKINNISYNFSDNYHTYPIYGDDDEELVGLKFTDWEYSDRNQNTFLIDKAFKSKKDSSKTIEPGIYVEAVYDMEYEKLMISTKQVKFFVLYSGNKATCKNEYDKLFYFKTTISPDDFTDTDIVHFEDYFDLECYNSFLNRYSTNPILNIEFSDNDNYYITDFDCTTNGNNYFQQTVLVYPYVVLVIGYVDSYSNLISGDIIKLKELPAETKLKSMVKKNEQNSK